ncbi:GrpB family protein [Agrobacterium vitis]|uniref:GrpB family protein n=1 Tax=Agrobacterium vitis TaxID=373 RepID=A0A368NS96_AGRVI|nr:GrpB family protein [Agrobacterium vitis]KAA3517690.1 GrpB family protein [Agrobacterium vitis]KAA3523756.1 GrpB family protein [Agrobacterium vitis]KAA3524121.1 GrpB family protein [Agrobacterium vitis]MCF1476870.1 GrpB family protein [Agrobacterium vitis]MUZ96022.1 GrpB family protein [Agrobacterium vitis]
MLGLKHNVNLLVDYDPAWEGEFVREQRRISNALGAIARSIEHYGSTAIRGMKAKPILDILIGVMPLADWEKCRESLLQLGYDYAANAGVPGHHIFGRGKDQTERTHLVHVVEYMGESWCSNLAFRDALRRDPLLRDAYVAEKQQAIARSPASRTEYNTLKQTFIDSVKASL